MGKKKEFVSDTGEVKLTLTDAIMEDLRKARAPQKPLKTVEEIKQQIR